MKHRVHKSEVWNAHSLYATKLSNELADIKTFLKKYPTEIVILHLKGGWNEMTEIHFKKVNEDLKK